MLLSEYQIPRGFCNIFYTAQCGDVVSTVDTVFERTSINLNESLLVSETTNYYLDIWVME